MAANQSRRAGYQDYVRLGELHVLCFSGGDYLESPDGIFRSFNAALIDVPDNTVDRAHGGPSCQLSIGKDVYLRDHDFDAVSMFTRFVNSLLDVLGIFRAVLYKIFRERRLSHPHPMFNVVEVKEGEVDTFEQFLREAEVVSGKLNTPISIGPYKEVETRVFIYVTHFHSTWNFMRVMMRLTLSIVTRKRAAAVHQTAWSCCQPTISEELADLRNVLVVGVPGASDDFREFLRQYGVKSAATVETVKDVRGISLSTYFVLPDRPDIESALQEFCSQHNDVVVFKAVKLNEWCHGHRKALCQQIPQQ